MNEWWQAILTLAIGFVLGVIASILFRRRVSDNVGERTDNVGQLIDEVGDSVERTEEGIGESVGTSESVADSVERLTDTSTEFEDTIADARGAVGRIKDLIEAERKRNEKSESKEQDTDR